MLILKRMSIIILCKIYCTLLCKGYAKVRKTNGGAIKLIPVLLRVLTLQQLFTLTLSDKELKFKINYRRSFEKFVELGLITAFQVI